MEGEVAQIGLVGESGIGLELAETEPDKAKVSENFTDKVFGGRVIRHK